MANIFNNMFKKKDAASNVKADSADSFLPEQYLPGVDNNTELRLGMSFGVQDKFALKDSEDMVVVGRVDGTVNVGMNVLVKNFGVDDAKGYRTTIKGIEIKGKKFDSVSNSTAALLIHMGTKLELRTGTVIFNEYAHKDELYNSYMVSIGDYYANNRELDLTEEEMDAMSITDLAEAWRLYAWKKNKENDESARELVKSRINKVADVICKKIMSSTNLYTIINKRTGEPHMFSKIMNRNDGTYMSTTPDIMLVTKAYVDQFREMYPAETYDIARIISDETGEGMKNFLGGAFYLNGAGGVQILSDKTAIGAEKLVPKPDPSTQEDAIVPVTNPDLNRWILIVGQLPKPENEEMKRVYGLYYSIISRELPKAKLLVPLKVEGEGSDNTVEENSGAKISVPTVQVKEGRNAVRVFTDWSKLYQSFEPTTRATVSTVEELVKNNDIVINLGKFPASSFLVTKEMFESIAK